MCYVDEEYEESAALTVGFYLASGLGLLCALAFAVALSALLYASYSLLTGAGL